MKYTVKNFKIFDEKGVTFDIAPITMLTGCNSSGKSSLVKSMMVLGDYLKKVKSYLNTVSKEDKLAALAQPADFASGIKDTGGFDNVLNENSTNGLITFQYTVASKLLMEDVTVTLSFEKDTADPLNRNAKLHEVSFQRADGTPFYRAGHNLDGKYYHSLIDLSVIKDPFLDFAVKATLTNLEDYIKQEEDPIWLIDAPKQAMQFLEKCKSRLNHIKESLPKSFDYHSDNIAKEDLNLFKDLLDDKASDDEDLIEAFKFKTVLYIPWLKILDGVDKKNVRKTIEDKLKDVSLSDEERNDLEYCVSDFENSDSKSFYEYYQTIEHKVCKFSIKLDFQERSLEYLIFGPLGSDIKLATNINNSGPQHFVLPRECGNGTEKKDINKSVIYPIMSGMYAKLDAVYGENHISTYYDNPYYVNNLLHQSMQKYFEALWEDMLAEDVP